MSITEFNQLEYKQAKGLLMKCCGSGMWVNDMMENRPFEDLTWIQQKADEIWANCLKEDALEAFSHHPKIGDRASIAKKFASTKEWAGDEQKGMDQATSELIDGLANGNQQYEEKFGYIFIVYATGKSANEMLEILESRLSNPADKELSIAMEEQHKITKLRLNKLFL